MTLKRRAAARTSEAGKRGHDDAGECVVGDVRLRRPSRDRVLSAGRSRCEEGLPSETLRKRVRQSEADGGLRRDLPTGEQRDELKRLKRSHES
jgi:hypothetical protein